MATNILFFLLLTGCWFVVFKYVLIPRRRKKDAARAADLRALKAVYEEALREGDREKAIAAGERFYKLLRGGSLFLSDQEAIRKDLSEMR